MFWEGILLRWYYLIHFLHQYHLLLYSQQQFLNLETHIFHSLDLHHFVFVNHHNKNLVEKHFDISENKQNLNHLENYSSKLKFELRGYLFFHRLMLLFHSVHLVANIQRVFYFSNSLDYLSFYKYWVVIMGHRNVVDNC